MIKLIGVLIVIVGFILKLDTLAVVVVAGVVTGFVGGMNFMEILTVLGNSFVTNRTATLFVLTLSVIGMCERYGLKDKAVDFIKSIKNASTGRLLAIWQVIRTFASAFSLRIGGHAQFIRPLINPMAQAAYVAKYGDASCLIAIPLGIAGWLRYMLAVDDEGKKYELAPDPMNEEIQEQLKDIAVGHPETFTDQLKPILSNERIFFIDLYQAGVGEKIELMFREMISGPGAVKAMVHKYVR